MDTPRSGIEYVHTPRSSKKWILNGLFGKMVLGTVLLGAALCLKDNVHFGSTIINNPKRNHYVWGISPEVTVTGNNGKGNIRNFGILRPRSILKENSQLVGNLSAYSLAGSKVTLNGNSQICGDTSAYGFIFDEVKLEQNAQIVSGSVYSCGLVLKTHRGWGFLSNTEIGISNYVHGQERRVEDRIDYAPAVKTNKTSGKPARTK